MLPIFSDFLDVTDNTHPDLSHRVHYQKDSVSIDLPGYSKEEITINILSDTTILIIANNLSTNTEDPRGILYTKIYISDNINLNNIEASFTQGILSLKYPQKELPKPRTIVIK